MNIYKLKQSLAGRLTAKRWQHTLGCSDYAVELAKHFGLSTKKAYLAALLHDACRDESAAELLLRAESYGYCISEAEREQPVLLHGPLAALWAERELHIDDAEILEAIRCHTTGAPDIGPLAMLIFTSDCLEPGRAYPQAESLRRSAKVGTLQELTLAALRQSLHNQLERREPIAIESVLWYNQLVNPDRQNASRKEENHNG